jgi:hypothetical protein
MLNVLAGNYGKTLTRRSVGTLDIKPATWVYFTCSTAVHGKPSLILQLPRTPNGQV